MPYKYPDGAYLWCSAGNSLSELEKCPGKSLALVPCAGSACTQWEDSRCGHIERVGKHGRI